MVARRKSKLLVKWRGLSVDFRRFCSKHYSPAVARLTLWLYRWLFFKSWMLARLKRYVAAPPSATLLDLEISRHRFGFYFLQQPLAHHS
jgi:hypothetical protein